MEQERMLLNTTASRALSVSIVRKMEMEHFLTANLNSPLILEQLDLFQLSCVVKRTSRMAKLMEVTLLKVIPLSNSNLQTASSIFGTMIATWLLRHERNVAMPCQ